MARWMGKVVKHPTAAGSKSERRALFLRMPDGQELILRRLGAHAFHDEVLEGLEGKQIEGEGEVRGTTLLLTDWHELDE